jgi:hypothetical protein
LIDDDAMTGSTTSGVFSQFLVSIVIAPYEKLLIAVCPKQEAIPDPITALEGPAGIEVGLFGTRILRNR